VLPKDDTDHKLPVAKPRYIRDTGSSSENDHLWSVAYSDMLMVLLGFFVIFFSDGKNKKSEIIDQIATELHGSSATKRVTNPKAKPDVATTTTSGAISSAATALPNIDQIAKDLDLTYESVNAGKTIRINFPDNIYNKRQYRLSAATKAKLKQLITVLSPYKDKLKLHFIGHSDSSRVAISSEKFSNNFQLSALRATQVALFFEQNGFPSSNIVTSGAANNINSSRSISMTISSEHFLLSH